MSRVDFHILNIEDRTAYEQKVCEHIASLYLEGKHIVMLCEQPEHWDTLLWSYQPDAFIPHAINDDGLAVNLCTTLPTGHPIDLIVNMAPRAVQCDGTHIIEILYQEPDALKAGRERYRSYQKWGYQVETFK